VLIRVVLVSRVIGSHSCLSVAVVITPACGSMKRAGDEQGRISTFFQTAILALSRRQQSIRHTYTYADE
jgi:hypothetical protein